MSQGISRLVMTSFSINPVLCRVAVFDKKPKFWSGKSGMALCVLLQKVQFNVLREPVINILREVVCMKSVVQFQSVAVSPGRTPTPHRKIQSIGYFSPLIGLYNSCHPLKPLLKAGRPGIFQKIGREFLQKAGARGNL